MTRAIRLIALFAAILPLAAETRVWRNADASASFEGDYLSHDDRQVSIRHRDGRLFRLEIDKLHPDDRRWLDLKSGKTVEDAPAHPDAVFDSLCYGDTRREVEAKLKASRFVESTIDETFFGRLGLNGTFRTRQQIGGLHCELYFDWTPESTLDEITLQTQPLDAADYDTRLQRNWSELIKILSQLHGKPLHAADYPKLTALENDAFLASHLWSLEGGGSALLGTSMQGGKYLVVVRFTEEKIEPNRRP